MNNPAKPYLHSLTSLRGLAALLIVIFHCQLIYQPFVSRSHSQFLMHCWLWVDFFFVLSGFILSYVYREYFSGAVTWKNYERFIGARFARIYPIYLLTTVWAFIISIVIRRIALSMDPFFLQTFNPGALPASLALVQSMHIGYITPPLNTPAWSLSTEWWAYVLFPFMVPLFSKMSHRGRIVMTALLVIAYILLRNFLGPVSYGNSRPTLNLLTDFGFLRCLAGFLTGMLTYSFYENRSGYAIVRRDWFFGKSFIGAILSMSIGLNDVVIIVFFPCIVLSAAYNQSRVLQILQLNLLRRLGDWSYSIYMVHMPIIFTLMAARLPNHPALFADDFGKFMNRKPTPEGIGMCVIIVLLTLLVSSQTYRWVEVPARNYLNTWFKAEKRQIPSVSCDG